MTTVLAVVFGASAVVAARASFEAARAIRSRLRCRAPVEDGWALMAYGLGVVGWVLFLVTWSVR